MEMGNIKLEIGEALLVLTGVLILISAGAIAHTGSLTLWGGAKIVYALGLLLLLLDI